MRKVLRRRPSASMVVSIVALVLAASGTAIATSNLVNGDKLIRRHSLSGNRLHNHTLTGTQINLKRLGTVPSAVVAGTAANANALGGQAPGAFEPAGNFIRTGLVTAPSGQTVPFASFGPFALELACIAGGGNSVEAEIQATSTEGNSDGYGTPMATAGTAYIVLSTGKSTNTFNEFDDNSADFFTPSGKTYIADITVGQNYLGAACFANALVSPS